MAYRGYSKIPIPFDNGSQSSLRVPQHGQHQSDVGGRKDVRLGLPFRTCDDMRSAVHWPARQMTTGRGSLAYSRGSQKWGPFCTELGRREGGSTLWHPERTFTAPTSTTPNRRARTSPVQQPEKNRIEKMPPSSRPLTSLVARATRAAHPLRRSPAATLIARSYHSPLVVTARYGYQSKLPVAAATRRTYSTDKTPPSSAPSKIWGFEEVPSPLSHRHYP